MKTENRVKKVDYKELSDKRCKACGRQLKKNSELKGHTQCYVCFKISKGKKEMHEHKTINGVKTLVKTVDLVQLQKQNKRLWLR